MFQITVFCTTFRKEVEQKVFVKKPVAGIYNYFMLHEDCLSEVLRISCSLTAGMYRNFCFQASKRERSKNSPTYKDLDFMEMLPEGLLLGSISFNNCIVLEF